MFLKKTKAIERVEILEAGWPSFNEILSYLSEKD